MQKKYHIMLRLEQEDGLVIEDAAHAARLPIAVFAREILLGRVPKLAPPAPADLSFGASLLLKICNGLVSNLSQIEGHASRHGGVLEQLVGPGKALQEMSKQAEAIGLSVKSGSLDEAVIKHILEDLEPASRALNDILARPLNEGKTLPLEVWKQVLTDLQAALPSDGTKVKQ